MVKTLVLSSLPVLNGAVLGSFLRKGVTDLSSVDISTQSGQLSKDSLAQTTYNVIFSFSEREGVHTPTFLAVLLDSLLPGGTITIIEKGHKDTEAIEKQLWLAGFVGCKTAISANGDAMVEANRPSWKNGSKSAINLKPTTKLDNASKATEKTRGWKVVADGDEEDLLDDNELLTEEDNVRPAAPGLECAPSKTKSACKNCTCGRAEGKMEKMELTPELLENPQTSGCGSCGLGDAFRCASCPYRGLPAFEQGKRIQLPPGFLTADA